MRRAMSKKKHDVMEKERQNFIHGALKEDGSVECVGAIKNGVSEKIANEIFDEMASFAAYAFNKSHAAAYALVAYQTAYLKYYYKSEYMAALMSSVLSNSGKINEYIANCKSTQIKVLPPNVNTSENGFTVVGKDINFGLLAIKRLGKGAISSIVQERTINGKYKDLPDFCERIHGKDVNKAAIEALIKSGAFDDFPHNRHEMMMSFEQIIDDIERTRKKNIKGQINLFDNSDQDIQAYTVPTMPEYDIEQLLSMEKETVGLYVSGHPLDQVGPLVSTIKLAYASKINSDDEITMYNDGTRVYILGIVQSKKIMTTKKNDLMAFVQLEDKTAVIEIVVFPKIYEKYSRHLNEGTILVVEGRVSNREDEPSKILCERIFTLEEVKKKKNNQNKKGLFIKLKNPDDENIEKVMTLLNQYKGENDVYFYFTQTSAYL
ncbi:MAG: OB-fold nucleic acid binding domain-containing protein, partial [Brevinema sp.]